MNPSPNRPNRFFRFLGIGPSTPRRVAGAAGLLAGVVVLTGLTDDICESVARAAKTASFREAEADYWLGVAKCRNGPQGSRRQCIRDLHDELEEARDLAREQFEAREEVCELVGEGPYNPHISPAEFSPDVTNPYYPLVPGRTLVYEKVDRDGVERTEVTTLADVVEIADVRCRPVRDVVRENGQIVEDTTDWFSQDAAGNAWYFGEIALNYEDGFLDNIDGSWRFGKDGAQPGIIMKANPRRNDAYRQEYLINEAEDVARVVALGEVVMVRAGRFENCVKTEDFSALEPGSREWKFYATGIGLVLEVNPRTGSRNELIQIIGP